MQRLLRRPAGQIRRLGVPRLRLWAAHVQGQLQSILLISFGQNLRAKPNYSN
jgi:hypothetical protein